MQLLWRGCTLHPGHKSKKKTSTWKYVSEFFFSCLSWCCLPSSTSPVKAAHLTFQCDLRKKLDQVWPKKKSKKTNVNRSPKYVRTISTCYGLTWPNQKSIAEELQSSQRDLEDIRPRGPIWNAPRLHSFPQLRVATITCINVRSITIEWKETERNLSHHLT